MTVDSFSQSSSNALDDLDPLSRALLDLSLKRGMSDAEIAEILGTDPESVLENRVALLRSLAEQVAPEAVDDDLPELESAVAGRVYADTDLADAEEAAVQAEEPVAVVEPERKRRSPLATLVPFAILVALALGAIWLVTGGDDESTDAPGRAAAPEQPTGGDADPRRVRLTPLGGSDARGTAVIDDNGLRLRLRNLPEGRHEVWVYNSVIDARRIGSIGAGGVVRAKLPPNARRDFKYLDFSREPADGNPNHSGQSILRVELDKLSRSGD